MTSRKLLNSVIDGFCVLRKIEKTSSGFRKEPSKMIKELKNRTNKERLKKLKLLCLKTERLGNDLVVLLFEDSYYSIHKLFRNYFILSSRM